MVEIDPGLAVNSSVAAERTPPSSFRKVIASLLKQSSPAVPVAGILGVKGSTPLAVTGDASTMVYHVSKGYAVTTRTGQGAYIVGTSVDVDVAAPAAHSTLSRIDRVYIVQPDPELSEVGKPRIDVVAGTPASSPVAPAIPTGALMLAQKTVGPGVTNLATGAAITGRPALTGINVLSVAAEDVTDPQNLDVGRVNGSKITVATTAPASPAVGDVWIDYS